MFFTCFNFNILSGIWLLLWQTKKIACYNEKSSCLSLSLTIQLKAVYNSMGKQNWCILKMWKKKRFLGGYDGEHCSQKVWESVLVCSACHINTD